MTDRTPGLYWVVDDGGKTVITELDSDGDCHFIDFDGWWSSDNFTFLGPVASSDYVAGLERALSEYVVLGAGKCTISKAHADMGRAALAAKP